MGKYEEALERAKQGLPMDEIFPELKENEDEKMRNDIMVAVENSRLPYERIEEIRFYLNNQKEQKPAEWSEEDKNRFNNLCSVIDESESWNDVSKQAFKDWIKSLRSQPHWRPSEEQMEALERCVDYLDDSDNEDAAVIGSLCHDLKML